MLQIAALSAIIGSVPAFLLLMHGSTWSTFLGLLVLALPVALYLANLAASLPALFPTESRYGGMGITYNISVALFAGTAPVIMQGLVTLTDQPLAPAFWIMLTSLAGLFAARYMKESARRPMPGAMPTVATQEEARELVATQDTNPDLDLDELSDLLAADDLKQLQTAR